MFWANFLSYFVAKTFQKSPNLVTLSLTDIGNYNYYTVSFIPRSSLCILILIGNCNCFFVKFIY